MSIPATATPPHPLRRLFGYARPYRRDAVQASIYSVLNKVFDVLPDACLSKVFLNYPDPWPKARHHRRRFVSPGYLQALARAVQVEVLDAGIGRGQGSAQIQVLALVGVALRIA